jgi:hypothetical protein
MWNSAITDYALATRHPANGLKRALQDIPVDPNPGEEVSMSDPHG